MAFYYGPIRRRKRGTLRGSRTNRGMELLSFARNKIVPSRDFWSSLPDQAVLLLSVEFPFDIMYKIPGTYGSGWINTWKGNPGMITMDLSRTGRGLLISVCAKNGIDCFFRGLSSCRWKRRGSVTMRYFAVQTGVNRLHFVFFIFAPCSPELDISRSTKTDHGNRE